MQIEMEASESGGGGRRLSFQIAVVAAFILVEIFSFRSWAGYVATTVTGHPTGAGAEVLAFQYTVVVPTELVSGALTTMGMWLFRKKGRATVWIASAGILCSLLLFVWAALRLYSISNLGG